MLTRILHEFKKQNGALELRALSHELDIQPDALQGMLEHLEQLGKLERESPDSNCALPCAQCASAADCQLTPAISGNRWRLKK